MTTFTQNTSNRGRFDYNDRQAPPVASIKTHRFPFWPKANPPAGKSGTTYAIDVDMQSVLDAHAALGAESIEGLEADEARSQPTHADAVRTVLEKQGPEMQAFALVSGVTNVDASIPGPSGSLPVRIFTPSGVGPFPVVVYFHGGGWVLADKNVYDAGARGLAQYAHAVVVSVDYRLAPEAKFPAQHDDALAAYRWVCGNAASFNGDPKRIALAGEGAGGNLAIATAIASRQHGLTPPLHVLAIYPITQISGMSTPSSEDSKDAKPLSGAMTHWYATQVFSKPDDAADFRIGLVDADVSLLPTVTLINARVDPRRSDGDMLAAALKRSGVKVEHVIYEGVTHEFFGMSAVVAKAREAQKFAGQQLRASFRIG